MFYLEGAHPHDVAGGVAVLLLDPAGDVEALLGRHLLAALAHQLLNEQSQVLARDGDALDGAANHKPLRHRYHMRHAVATVDHRPGQRAVRRALLGGQRRRQRQHRLRSRAVVAPPPSQS
eukprot:6671259-Pyramimonas_sp.AAC.1